MFTKHVEEVNKKKVGQKTQEQKRIFNDKN